VSVACALSEGFPYGDAGRCSLQRRRVAHLWWDGRDGLQPQGAIHLSAVPVISLPSGAGRDRVNRSDLCPRGLLPRADSQRYGLPGVSAGRASGLWLRAAFWATPANGIPLPRPRLPELATKTVVAPTAGHRVGRHRTLGRGHPARLLSADEEPL
jgi:hypothetical protein